MNSSLSVDLGTELDRQSIEKVVVKLISEKTQAANAREFWSLVAEKAGSTYSITRGGTACERIYRDVQSKNKDLPNEKAYIRRMMNEATALDTKELQEWHEKREAYEKNAVYTEVDKIYSDPKDRALQQIAGAALGEMERREMVEKANTKAQAEAEAAAIKKGRGKKKV